MLAGFAKERCLSEVGSLLTSLCIVETRRYTDPRKNKAIDYPGSRQRTRKAAKRNNTCDIKQRQNILLKKL